MNRKDELIHEIGALIVSNKRYSNPDPSKKIQDWDALALAVTVTPENKEMTGYLYEGDLWQAGGPSGMRPLLEKLQELQELTKSPDGETWKQCLIHITKPDYKINIQLEYDDPRRWSLKKASLNMADYANSLRPPKP